MLIKVINKGYHVPESTLPQQTMAVPHLWLYIGSKLL